MGSHSIPQKRGKSVGFAGVLVDLALQSKNEALHIYYQTSPLLYLHCRSGRFSGVMGRNSAEAGNGGPVCGNVSSLPGCGQIIGPCIYITQLLFYGMYISVIAITSVPGFSVYSMGPPARMGNIFDRPTHLERNCIPWAHPCGTGLHTVGPSVRNGTVYHGPTRPEQYPIPWAHPLEKVLYSVGPPVRNGTLFHGPTHVQRVSIPWAHPSATGLYTVGPPIWNGTVYSGPTRPER